MSGQRFLLAEDEVYTMYEYLTTINDEEEEERLNKWAAEHVYHERTCNPTIRENNYPCEYICGKTSDAECKYCEYYERHNTVCSLCGNELGYGAKYCKQCGAKVIWKYMLDVLEDKLRGSEQ